VVTRADGGRSLTLWLAFGALLVALVLATPPLRRRDEVTLPMIGAQAAAPDEAPVRTKVGSTR
jgi:hypothetical protein